MNKAVNNSIRKMSQPSVASYFVSRKRITSDDVNIGSAKRRVDILKQTTLFGRKLKRINESNTEIPYKITRIERPIKLKPKNVPFIRGGPISPRKHFDPSKDLQNAVSSEKSKNIKSVDEVPSKLSNSKFKFEKDNINILVKKELNFEEVKKKVSRSAKLQELKASLIRLNELDQVRKLKEEQNKQLSQGDLTIKYKQQTVTLKEFNTIEVEVLTSPKKGFTTPTKLIPSTLKSIKHGLMSPKNDESPKRILFSPSKDGTFSMVATPPAYQRFLNLTESGKFALQLPFKYRYLIEIFKSVDSICAMFYNRKEIVTFKKLKPAVQRMLRRNFCEFHLMQIKHLYPQAFTFSQMNTGNFGSTSKQDYFQLMITPIIDDKHERDAAKINEENEQLSIINPKVLIERYQKFSNILLNEVKEEHEKFLHTLEPPLSIPKDKITRWHPEFDLENCPDIEKAPLPEPPNIENLSSAKDILLTARNLFNTSTAFKRTKELEIEMKPNKLLVPACGGNNTTCYPITNALKGIPQSLLEKIRFKQAAKAINAITRRPSQDRETTKYSRLPELAKHLRNVFITEKKSVLPVEVVIKKIENSFRLDITAQEIKEHFQMLSKECPKWIVFHAIRKTIYLKLAKDMDLNEVIEKLENTANEKCK